MEYIAIIFSLLSGFLVGIVVTTNHFLKRFVMIEKELVETTDDLQRIEDHPDFKAIQQQLEDALEKNREPLRHELYPEEPKTSK